MSRLIRIPALSILLLLLTGAASVAQTADFTASPVSGCAPLFVQFTDNSSGAITSYSWDFGNGAALSTLTSPGTTYSTPGTYTVIQTVTGPGGTDTQSAVITVYDQPAVAFAATAPTAGCTPHSVQFSSTVTPNSPGTAIYDWNFGDGTTGSGTTPAHSYTTPGTYSVTLTVTNGAGCSRAVTRNAYVTAYPIPVAGFGASQTLLCSVPATVSFTNTSTNGTAPFTAAWNFGDGGTGTGNVISHTYTAGGSFTVSLTVTDAHGCISTVSNPAFVTVVAANATFTGPASVCADAIAHFVNTTSGASGAFWDFGDGSTTTGTTADHSYITAGTYNVTLTVIIDGCPKSVVKPITVNPKPTPTITMSPSIPCPPPVTVSFSGSSPVPATYSWSWTGGGATGQTITKTYPNGPYLTDVIKLIATTAAGCQDSVVKDDIYIRDIIVEISPGGPVVEGCKTLVVNFGVSLFSHLPPLPPAPPLPAYPLPAVAWYWDFGNGHTSTLANPTDSFVNTGNYTVSCTVTTANGCTKTGLRSIHVDVPIKPAFTASPVVICPKDTVTFVNQTVHITGLLYSWNLGDTTFSKADPGSVKRAYPLPGMYTVTLYSNNKGCIDSAVRTNYITIHPPGARFTETIECNPHTTVHFYNTSIDPTSQIWDFGDGTTDTSFSPTHNYPTTDTYTVTLTVFNSVYGCRDVYRKDIILFNPVLDFVANDRTACKDQYIRFEGGFTGGPGAVLYGWLFDRYATSFSTDNKVDYQFSTRGLHDVSLITSSGNGCLDTLKKPGYIFMSQPDVHFYATPPIGCQPLPVRFTDTSRFVGVNNIQRHWDFGDGDTATRITSTVNHTYPSKGLYTVTLLVTDSLGCKDSLVRNNYVSVNKAQAFFKASDTSVCINQPVTFRDTLANAGMLLHQWSFGDGGVDTGTHPIHRYRVAGLYTVRLIAIDSVGCRDTFTRSNYIRANGPRAAFTPSSRLAICPPLSVTFSNTSTGAVSYSWDFGTGGGPVVVTNPVNLFSTAGLYNITLAATDVNGCTDTARDTVRVLGYNGAFTYTPTNGCVPMTVQFSTPIAAIPQIIWDFGDGATNSTTNSAPTSHTYTSAGEYLPKVIFSSSGTCTSLSTGLTTIRVDKVTADFHWSVPCSGVPFSLRDSSRAVYSPPNAWTWNFGGGNTASGATASASFSTPGPHPVTLTAINATGCRDSVTLPVFINPPPIVRAPDDRGVCPGATASLTATGALTYTWSPASLVSCTACTTTQVSLTADTLLITVTGTDTNGCKNSDSVLLYKQIKTTSSTRPGGAICIGESFRLFAEGAEQYEWSPAASLDSPFIASPLATPTTTTTYIVAAKESSCLTDSQRVTVVVHPLPQFSAGEDQTIRLGGAVTLQATRSGIDHIVWKADTTLGCVDCFAPNAYPYYTRTYYATGYSEYGCAATDSVTVHVRCNGSLVYIPNTFTPNGDGLNDYFYPRGEGIGAMSMMRVYNRWGEVVFERANVSLNDELSGWDGRYKGALLPPDVYVYTMESRCATGEPVSFRGDISIVR